MSRETYNYKRRAINIAKDLCYPETTVLQLKAAQTESEICRIMQTARERGMV